jgi:hypothetical protein
VSTGRDHRRGEVERDRGRASHTRDGTGDRARRGLEVGAALGELMAERRAEHHPPDELERRWPPRLQAYGVELHLGEPARGSVRTHALRSW